MTSQEQRMAEFDQLIRAQSALLTGRKGRAGDVARLSLQAMNESTTGQRTSEDEQHLIFWLNEREFAVKAALIQSVERPVAVTPVPNVAPWLMGVMNLRGSIVSVVDLKAFLNLEPSIVSQRTRFLALQFNEMMISFIVDSVNEMLTISPETIIGGRASQATIPPWVEMFASESVVIKDRIIVILDVERLLFSEKMQNF